MKNFNYHENKNSVETSSVDEEKIEFVVINVLDVGTEKRRLTVVDFRHADDFDVDLFLRGIDQSQNEVEVIDISSSLPNLKNDHPSASLMVACCHDLFLGLHKYPSKKCPRCNTKFCKNCFPDNIHYSGNKNYTVTCPWCGYITVK